MYANNILNLRQKTLMEKTCKQGNFKKIKELHQNGVDMNTNIFGYNPIGWASKNGNIKLIQYICNNVWTP